MPVSVCSAEMYYSKSMPDLLIVAIEVDGAQARIPVAWSIQ